MNADITALPEYVRDHRLAKLATGVATEDDPTGYSGEVVPADRIEDAEVITSIDESSPTFFGAHGHRPILDIDIPMHIIPSTTPGHGHLYIDMSLTWHQYERLLSVLADCKIIERGYYNVSVERGHTAVRLPWVKKEPLEPLHAPAIRLPDPPDRTGMEWADKHDERL